ncbi:MAG: alpha/beta fold hydrolase [Flavobacterium sp.]
MLKSINYKNTPIHFTESGTGTVVVLLHGFLENKDMWKPLQPVFENRYRMIAIDLLGHGETGCVGYIHTMEEQAAMVFEVIQKLKVKKAIFIGHSMGGYIALALAESHPEVFQGLVLLNSTSKSDSEERKKNRDRAIYAVKQNHRNFVSLSVANLFGEESRNRLQKEIKHTQLEALKTPLQGIVAALEGMKIRKDRKEILKNAHFPILLVLGKKDGVLSFENSLDQIENTTVVLKTLEDGHMSHLENTKELISILKEFIKQI